MISSFNGRGCDIKIALIATFSIQQNCQRAVTLSNTRRSFEQNIYKNTRRRNNLLYHVLNQNLFYFNLAENKSNFRNSELRSSLSVISRYHQL